MKSLKKYLRSLIPDDCPEFDISAHIAKTDGQFYTGIIVISTDEYATPKEAIDDIVWIARNYDLGFDASDIDLWRVLNECKDNA